MRTRLLAILALASFSPPAIPGEPTTAIDAPACTQDVELSIRVLHVPDGFADEVGVDPIKSVFSAREVKLFSALVSRERKGGNLSELAHPCLKVRDGQAANVSAGNDEQVISVRVKPKVQQDGSISLRAELTIATIVNGAFQAETVETTATVADTGALIVGGVRMKDGKKQELLFVITPKIVR